MTQHPDDSRIEARLLGAVMAFELAKDMIANGIWMLNADLMLGRIARLSSSAEVFAYAWMALSVLLSPYWMMQVTGLGQAYRAPITRLACWGILASGVFWFYLAFISKGMDYDHITLMFLFHGSTCIFMAAILAYGLNAAQRRAQEDAP